MPGPEYDAGLRMSSHATIRRTRLVRFTRSRSTPSGTQVDSRVRRIARFCCASASSCGARLVIRRDHPRRRRRGHDDAGDGLAQTRRDVEALDGQRVQQLRRGRVADVDLEQPRGGLGVLVRRPCCSVRRRAGRTEAGPAAARSGSGLRLRLEHRVVVVGGERHHPVAGDEQLVPVALELSEPSSFGSAPVTSSTCSTLAADHVQPVAIGLDDVGLVDALLLDVRARVVDALADSAVGRSLSERAPGRRRVSGTAGRPRPAAGTRSGAASPLGPTIRSACLRA